VWLYNIIILHRYIDKTQWEGLAKKNLIVNVTSQTSNLMWFVKGSIHVAVLMIVWFGDFVQTDDQGSIPSTDKNIFFFTAISRLTLRPTQTPAQQMSWIKWCKYGDGYSHLPLVLRWGKLWTFPTYLHRFCCVFRCMDILTFTITTVSFILQGQAL
jgi:hypothetical protein